MQKSQPGVDVPILRERLHYSYVWDKIPLIGIEDLEIENQQKDRTMKAI